MEPIVLLCDFAFRLREGRLMHSLTSDTVRVLRRIITVDFLVILLIAPILPAVMPVSEHSYNDAIGAWR